MNAQHSSKSVEHYTPVSVVEASREALGGIIDLDPCSCNLANEVVKAAVFYNEFINGLKHTWCGKVFVNPPGGRVNGKSQPIVWWEKLLGEWDNGNVDEAIFVGFSIEILQTSQRCAISLLDFPFCIPNKRMKFWNPETSGDSPTHANVISYIGPNKIRFRESFRSIGKVVIPS